MKIALVSGHYIPRLGYMEVHLSKAFAQLNHQVQVFTSDVFPSYLKNQKGDFGSPPKGVKVTRLKPFFSLGQILFAKGLSSAIIDFNPDLIIVIGLGKRFPKPVYKLDYHIFTLLGDNSFSYAHTGLKARILYRLFKRPTYILGIAKSDRLFAYTPETLEVVQKSLGNHFSKKLQAAIQISLGYWSNEFYFDQDLRNKWRSNLGFNTEDKVVITATRIVPEKKLEEQITHFKNAPEHVKWLLLGDTGNSYSVYLKERLEAELGKDRFMMLPYTSRVGLNAYYNAADLALFTVPAISNFEALGAGLKLRIPEIAALKKINNPDFKSSSTLQPITLDQFDYNRHQVSVEAKSHFDWLNIAEKILVDKPTF